MTYSSTLSCLYDKMNPIPYGVCNECGAAGEYLTIGITAGDRIVLRCFKHLNTPPAIVTRAGWVAKVNYYDCSVNEKEWLNYCPIRYDKTRPWGCEAHLSGSRGAALMCKDPSGACANSITDAFASTTSSQERVRFSVDLLRNFFDNNLCHKMAIAKKGGAA